jgi:hypothetical protein
MSEVEPVRRALLAVYDKTGVVARPDRGWFHAGFQRGHGRDPR